MRASIRTLALSTVTVLAATAAAEVAQANSCRALQPTDYLVYSLGDIDYENSDFEGLTGAAGTVAFESFHVLNVLPRVCANIVAGKDVILRHGQVRGGGIEAGGNVDLAHLWVNGSVVHGGTFRAPETSRSGSRRQISENVKNLPAVSRYYLDQSAAISARPANSAVTGDGVTLFFGPGTAGIRVYDLRAEQLDQARVLRFSGDASTLVIVNVRGVNAAITETDMQLEGGLTPSQIIFNFPDAQNLRISASGSRVHGVGATILAPRARVEFWNGLITGGLIAGSLCGNGQVNYTIFRWYQLAPVAEPPPRQGCQGGHCPYGPRARR